LYTARNKWQNGAKLIIEYPFLDPSFWVPLTSNLFWQNFPLILAEICFVVDYIHTLGVVHCDLKLQNFLINLRSNKPRIVLVDLDFLRPSFSSTNGKVFGTPGHIAPEILANQVITPESDVYSLGVSLKQYACQKTVKASVPRHMLSLLQRLEDLVNSLTETDRLHRPPVLLKALYSKQLIDDPTFSWLQKRLLMNCLFTILKNQPRKYFTEKTLSHFLVSHAKLLGIPDELMRMLDWSSKQDTRKTLMMLKGLVWGSYIDRVGEYWHVTVPDETTLRFLSRVRTLAGNSRVSPGVGHEEIVEGSDGERSKTEWSEKDRGPLERYLYLRKTLGESCGETEATAPYNVTRAQLLLRLGCLAKALGRTSEAIEHLESALQCTRDDSHNVRLEILLELIYLHLVERNYEKANELIKAGMMIAQDKDHPKLRLRLEKHRAWILAARGEFDRARGLYLRLIDEAKQHDYPDQQAKLNDELGTLSWRMGAVYQAERYFQQSLGIARKNNLPSEILSASRNLSLLYFDLYQLKRAIKYGKIAFRMATSLSERTKAASVYYVLVAANIIAGECRKAEHWLNKYLTHISLLQSDTPVGDYYALKGWVELSQGRLPMARETLQTALKVLTPKKRDRIAGKVEQTLAEIAFYEGKYEDCCLHLRNATNTFRLLSDERALVELKFLGAVNDKYNLDDTYAEKDLLPVLYELLEYSCFSDAVHCLFHILISTQQDETLEALKLPEHFQTIIKRQETPISKALWLLLEWYREKQNNGQSDIRLLKEAYLVLSRATHTFLSMLVCERIATIYSDELKTKLSQKYYLHAHKLAHELGNMKWAAKYKELAQEVRRTASDQKRLVQTLRNISEVLANVVDFQRAVDDVLKYAVIETGAERGVLLLRADETSELQVKSYVGCDEASLTDIKEFSRSIPEKVNSELVPLIIDNALTDKRTQNYKSIIAHNILSVICTPVQVRGKPLGVLYLDHSAIPAMFEADDLNFITAIANFVSVIISTAHQFKSKSVATERMRGELLRAGRSPRLITQNATMIEMLSKLPEIAKSNASVLLLGESGTGKEILCELIHELSSRSRGPLVKLNCAAIPATLVESELFGVAKKVATGVEEREGKFATADGGTLFLDEIGDLPLEVQAKVLRVLEYQQFEKVGSNRLTTTDVRLIYATNKDLKELIAQGKFRQDLYYRINTITIEIPPLRERPDDIMLLVQHFMQIFAADKQRYPQLSPSVVQILVNYPWPGNVRELRNLVERLCILYPGRYVQLTDLPKEFILAQSISQIKDKRTREHAERATIKHLLKENNGNQSKVARILGMPLTTLRRKIKKYDLY
jgi:Nif-specific regulatory protein